MLISLVSVTIDSFPYVQLFNSLSGITSYQATNLDDLQKKKQQIDLIFFDAAIGVEDIAQQINLYQNINNKLAKWLVIGAVNVQQSIQYLQMGASGILDHPSKKMLQDCFQLISKGQLYLDADLIQVLALRQIKKALLPFNQLTAREYDVFCMLAEGYSIKKIAELLSITNKTAFNCQTQIRNKLIVQNQQHIYKLAKSHGLVNTEKL